MDLLREPARKPRIRRSYIKSEANMVAYLDASREEADDVPTLIEVPLGNIARAYGMVPLVKDTELTRAGLYRLFPRTAIQVLGTVLELVYGQPRCVIQWHGVCTHGGHLGFKVQSSA